MAGALVLTKPCVRAVVRRASAPRRSPSPRGKGLCRRSGQRRHALGAGRNPRTERRAPRPRCARALPPGGAAYPRAVLDRDGQACVYRGTRADTIDHVRPLSRCGSTSGRMWWPLAPGATIAKAIGCSANLAGISASHPHSHRQRWLSLWMGQTRSGVGAIPRAELEGRRRRGVRRPGLVLRYTSGQTVASSHGPAPRPHRIGSGSCRTVPRGKPGRIG